MSKCANGVSQWCVHLCIYGGLSLPMRCLQKHNVFYLVYAHTFISCIKIMHTIFPEVFWHISTKCCSRLVKQEVHFINRTGCMMGTIYSNNFHQIGYLLFYIYIYKLHIWLILRYYLLTTFHHIGNVYWRSYHMFW